MLFCTREFELCDIVLQYCMHTVNALKFEHFSFSVLNYDFGYLCSNSQNAYQNSRGKTLIRLLLKKQSDLGLHYMYLSRPF